MAASLAKTYMYYAAKSGDTTAETAAQNIIDVIHQFYGDSLGFSAPETRTDYSNFTSAFNTTNFEGLFIPSGWTGSYPGLGSTPMTSADNTFLSIRPWYTSVANYPEVQNYLNGGAAPVFNYHRFWAEADIATAFDSFAFLFPNVSPPASATPTVTVTNPGTQTGTVGTAETLQVQASDSASGKTLTYSATDLPFGLSLSATTGAITGSPTMAGTYLTTLTVNDGSGASSVNLSWTISPKGTGNAITVTNAGQPDQHRRHRRQPADPGNGLRRRPDPHLQRHRPAHRPDDQLLHRADLRHPDHHDGQPVQRHRDRHRHHRGEGHSRLHLDGQPARH